METLLINQYQQRKNKVKKKISKISNFKVDFGEILIYVSFLAVLQKYCPNFLLILYQSPLTNISFKMPLFVSFLKGYISLLFLVAQIFHCSGMGERAV